MHGVESTHLDAVREVHFTVGIKAVLWRLSRGKEGEEKGG
jgi:hypothetical protein